MVRLTSSHDAIVVAVKHTQVAAPRGSARSGYLVFHSPVSDCCRQVLKRSNNTDECTTNNGGCDSQVTCTSTAGSRPCGACPEEHVGDGVIGCTLRPQDCTPVAVDDGAGVETCIGSPASLSGRPSTCASTGRARERTPLPEPET